MKSFNFIKRFLPTPLPTIQTDSREIKDYSPFFIERKPVGNGFYLKFGVKRFDLYPSELSLSPKETLCRIFRFTEGQLAKWDSWLDELDPIQSCDMSKPSSGVLGKWTDAICVLCHHYNISIVMFLSDETKLTRFICYFTEEGRDTVIGPWDPIPVATLYAYFDGTRFHQIGRNSIIVRSISTPKNEGPSTVSRD